MPTEETVRWERDTTPEWPQQEEEDRELRAEIDHATDHLVKMAESRDEDESVYSKDAFARAVSFLTVHSTKAHDLCSSYPPAPKIGLGPGESIDLHWKQEKWELLVNIPADANRMAVFYGDDYGKANFKGSFDPKTVNLGLVAWLMH
ncbi:MAG: hypothetical protein WBC78_21945 [Candidatus Sulfotelmatobacter sp.]